MPLEEAIRVNLIPALCGKDVNDLERRIIALPYRYGGLGMQNPVSTADREFQTSSQITSQLTDLICQQNNDVDALDNDAVKEKS